MRVAYLGPKASYTHQAALKAFSKHSPIAELVPCTTIEDAFAAVQSGGTDLAVVPFENSSNGSVVFTLDLFVDQSGKHSNIVIIDEVYLAVSHCLLGKKGDSDLSHVRKVYSHPQAWGQCKKFLGSKLHGIERQDVSSTSRAAEIAAGEEHSAAISSKLAADLNGLDVLAEGIEDIKGNTTRFFILEVAKPNLPQTFQLQEEWKTMVSFTIDHLAPGALADALAVFKAHNLNLTSINTRPSGKRNWMYVFFVEFRGHRDTAEVRAALDELQQSTKTYRWLGSFKDALAGTNGLESKSSKN